MKHRIEIVRWEDAHHQSDYADASDARVGQPCYVVSVGLLVKETRHRLVLAQSIYQDGTFGDFLTIPKRMINRRRRVALVEWKGGA